jgi:hypothetical protein
MSEEEKRILDMLAGGTISADEAYELLNALRPVAGVENTDDLAFPARGDESEKIQRMQAGLQRFRRLWRIPAFVVAGALLLSGTGLFLMYQSTADVAAIGLLCTWSIFLVALLGTIFALLSRRSAWLYLHVEEKDGSRFAFGMPVPLNLAGWSLKLARPFVPRNQLAHLETAAAFVSVMRASPEAEPLFIDVDDEDENVQIYIG